ncbi:MAG: DUF5946 family protein [Bacteroidota bacterium]
MAIKNGVPLLDQGVCQCCGARTQKGIYECVALFNSGFQAIDFSDRNNHIYRFLSVDAHALQHPEIHGRWSNHFHLTRLHLILTYKVYWTYRRSPKLSDYLNKYKARNPQEYLTPPKVLERGNTTITDFQEKAHSSDASKALVHKWAKEVYQAWHQSHKVVDPISKGFRDIL